MTASKIELDVATRQKMADNKLVADLKQFRHDQGDPCNISNPKCADDRVCFAAASGCACSSEEDGKLNSSWHADCVTREFISNNILTNDDRKRSGDKTGFIFFAKKWRPITLSWSVASGKFADSDLSVEVTSSDEHGPCDWDFDCAVGLYCRCETGIFARTNKGQCVPLPKRHLQTFCAPVPAEILSTLGSR